MKSNYSFQNVKISKEELKKYLLAYHNLLPPRQLREKSEIIDFVKKVGCFQFDPLDIVGRNPDLFLQSRVKNYNAKLLNELLYGDRSFIEGWDKMMSIYSVDDWPYFKRFRDDRYNYPGKSKDEVMEIAPQIREEIRRKGPVSSVDLDIDAKVDWAWRATNLSRAALESMFFWGELIIYKRINSRRVYDFAERYIDEGILKREDPNKTIEDYWDWHTLRRIGSMGVFNPKSAEAWLGILWIKGDDKARTLQRLYESGKILPLELDEIKGKVFFIKTEDYEKCTKMHLVNASQKAAILAPLDNLLWDRKAIKDIFDFEYVWEVYKPVAQRKYGYYVLPILCGENFIARFEPKYDKKQHNLTINNFWFENNVNAADEHTEALIECFFDFCNYLGASKLEINKGNISVKDFAWLKEVNKKLTHNL